MKRNNPWPVLLLAIAGTACGHQLVEFPLDAGETPDAANPPQPDAGRAQPPTVTSTLPSPGALGVDRTTAVSARFSTRMDPASINSNTFTVRVGMVPVAGTLVLDALTNTATFTPAATLAAATVHTATVTTGAKDAAGLALVQDHVWTFTTGSGADTTPPTVLNVLPLDGAAGVAVTTVISAGFSEAMLASTLLSPATTFTVTEFISGNALAGQVTYSGSTATFTPANALTPGVRYACSITTGAKDLAGNALVAPFGWTWTTTAAVDTTPPTVIQTLPANLAVGISTAVQVVVTFSESMDATTLNGATTALTVSEFVSGNAVPGSVTASGSTATFAPAGPLQAGMKYSATVSTGAKDVAGNALASPFTWTWTTSAAVDSTPPTVVVTTPMDGAVGVGTNTVINATFSESMDPATLTSPATTFVVTEFISGTGVPGVVGYVGLVATFVPGGPLSAATRYSCVITTAAKDVAGNAMAANRVWTWTTAAAGDTTAPTVIFNIPLNLATGVPTNSAISATFSEPMDSTSLVSPAMAFSVMEVLSASAVMGAVSYLGTTATFLPSGALLPLTQYQATIGTGARDVAGNPLASPHVWTWTTAAAPDTTAPTIIFNIPLNLATGVPTNSAISATFSEPMDATSLVSPATSFSVMEVLSASVVMGAVSYVGATATFLPSGALLPLTQYQATIGTGARDVAGNPLASPHVWTWTTAALPDTTAPKVIVTAPLDLATNVGLRPAISAGFDEAMDPATVSSGNVALTETATNASVVVTVSYDSQNKAAILLLQADLLPDTGYTVTVTNGVKDVAGNALLVPAPGGLPKPNPWQFRTAAAVVPPPPLAVNLRGAATFGIASRAGLTSTGVTVINGDVALYPLATCTDSTGAAGASQTCLVKVYSSPTGMTVNGSVYFAADPYDNGGTANSVTNDLTIAWSEGMAKMDTKGPVVGDELDGQVFLPGVYHNSSLGLAAGGTATMDAQNDANAVFFFKVDVSFVDSGTLLLPSKIVLSNMAQARNVWFVTGSDITIGSGTTWNGNILAGGTATVLDNSTVLGRVLAGAAGAGAVTLTGAASPSVTTITVPQ